MRSGFFILAKLSGGRRCSASLTEAKHSQGGKDARRCAWIRWNLVLTLNSNKKVLHGKLRDWYNVVR